MKMNILCCSQFWRFNLKNFVLLIAPLFPLNLYFEKGIKSKNDTAQNGSVFFFLINFDFSFIFLFRFSLPLQICLHYQLFFFLRRRQPFSKARNLVPLDEDFISFIFFTKTGENSCQLPPTS